MPELNVNLAILGAVISLLAGVVGLVKVARSSAAAVAREEIAAHREACPVREDIHGEIKERDDRIERRLGGIEGQLLDLNRYLRDRR